MSFAYFTLLYSDNYLPGALVLAHSLISQSSIIPRGILITSQVSEFAKSELAKVYDHIIQVDPVIANDNTPGFQLLNRPELANAYTKIHLWNQSQFSKIVFLDADTLPIKNIDDLFSNRWLNHENGEDENKIAACPDIGWPDIFNSGVFIAIPNKDTFENLRVRALDLSGKYSFDGGDQGLLNQYFTENSNWTRLPFIYNVTPSTSYQYLPAYSYYHSQVSIVHFIGAIKPWQGDGVGNREMAYKWRSIYRENYGEKSLYEKEAEIGEELKSGSYNNHSGSDSITTTTNYNNEYEIDRQTREREERDRQERERQNREKEEWERKEREKEEWLSNERGAKEREEREASERTTSAAAAAAAAALERLRIASQQSTTTIAPSVDRWDATKFIPPIDSKPEAPDLTITHYENAWDKPKPPPSAEPLEEHPSGSHQFPKFGKSTAKNWQQTPPPPVERVFPEDLPPSKSKSKQVKKKSSANSFSEKLKGYGSSFNWSDDSTAPEGHTDLEPDKGFQFPKLGKSVVQLPWERKDRPKVERVYPEDLPPPAYEGIQTKYKQQFSKQRRESLEKTEEKSEIEKLESEVAGTTTSSASSEHKPRHSHHKSEPTRPPPNPSSARQFVLKPILKHPKRTLDKDEEEQ